jgi:hypothetical protein
VIVHLSLAHTRTWSSTTHALTYSDQFNIWTRLGSRFGPEAALNWLFPSSLSTYHPHLERGGDQRLGQPGRGTRHERDARRRRAAVEMYLRERVSDQGCLAPLSSMRRQHLA